jgi:hypothetical protein
VQEKARTSPPLPAPREAQGIPALRHSATANDASPDRTRSHPPGNPSTGNTSPAAQFASALLGTIYERYTSSFSGSDFTDDYTCCSANTFLEHTESYAAGSDVARDYAGTWNVTNAASGALADVAYTTNNPNLPSSETVSITILSNGITIDGNGYCSNGPARC